MPIGRSSIRSTFQCSQAVNLDDAFWYIGIDDTDIAGSRGTNQLARSLVSNLAKDLRCVRIIRHQLLEDPRVPCTTKNGSASITLKPCGAIDLDSLAERVCKDMRSSYIVGSDPGLCLTPSVPEAVATFGQQAKRELVSQEMAFEVARRHDILLEGLGGTCDGVIGALAAVGLASTEDDGRIVQLADWPDDISGVHSVETLRRRGVMVRIHGSGEIVREGQVDVGKKLRPNRCRGENVLFVQCPDVEQQRPHIALKLP